MNSLSHSSSEPPVTNVLMFPGVKPDVGSGWGAIRTAGELATARRQMPEKLRQLHNARARLHDFEAALRALLRGNGRFVTDRALFGVAMLMIAATWATAAWFVSLLQPWVIAFGSTVAVVGMCLVLKLTSDGEDAFARRRKSAVMLAFAMPLLIFWLVSFAILFGAPASDLPGALKAWLRRVMLFSQLPSESLLAGYIWFRSRIPYGTGMTRDELERFIEVTEAEVEKLESQVDVLKAQRTSLRRVIKINDAAWHLGWFRRLLGLGFVVSVCLPFAGAVAAPAPLADARATNYVIAPSEYLSAPDALRVYQGIESYLFTAAPRGAHFFVTPAYEPGPEVVDMTIPDTDLPARREWILDEKLAILKRFILAGACKTNDALHETAAANLTAVARVVAAKYTASQRPTCVVVIGQPALISTNDPSFSMIPLGSAQRGPAIPSPATMVVTHDRSLYGLIPGGIENIRFGVCYLRPALLRNPLYEGMCRDFWAQYLSLNRGRLASWGNDLRTVLAAAGRLSNPPLPVSPLDRSNDRLEMIEYQRFISNRVMDISVDRVEWSKIPISSASGTPVPSGSPEEVIRKASGERDAVGLTWSGMVDVDIWVVRGPFEPANVLNFQNQIIAGFGRHIFDWQSAPSQAQLETVIFETGIDPLDPSIRVFANLYAGGGPVSGRVMLKKDGALRYGEFFIKAAAGNRALDWSSHSDPCWTEISLRSIMTGSVAESAARNSGN